MKALDRLLLAGTAGAALVGAQTLRQAIEEQDELSTLLAILDDNPDFAANIAALQNLTIFGPANDARDFSADRYSGAWSPDLESEILYHILDGTLLPSAAIIADGQERFYPTLSLPNADEQLDSPLNRTLGDGTRLGVSSEDGNVVLRASSGPVTVTTADIEYDNGIIHIIDALLFRPQPLITRLVSDTVSEPLSRAITNVTGLEEQLENSGLRPFTVFAPNAAAFEALGTTLEEISEDQLARIIEYHIVLGPVPFFSYDLEDGQQLNNTLLGGDESTLSVTIDGDDNVFINQAQVVSTDNLFSNGAIHVIDTVLNPDQLELGGSTSPGEEQLDFQTDAPDDYVQPGDRTSIVGTATTSIVSGETEGPTATTSISPWTATTTAGPEETGDPDGTQDDTTTNDDTEEEAEGSEGGGSKVRGSLMTAFLGTGVLVAIALLYDSV